MKKLILLFWMMPMIGLFGQMNTSLSFHQSSIAAIVYHGNDKFITTNAQDGQIKIWSLATKTCIKTLRGNYFSAFSLKYTADEQKLIVHTTYNVYVINMLKDSVEKKFENTHSIAWASDDKKLLIGSTYGFDLYDLTTGVIEWHQSLKYSRVLTLSPDKQLIAVEHQNKIDLWSVATRSFVKQLPPNFSMEGYKPRILFSVDGSCVVVARTYEVQYWSLKTDACIRKCLVIDPELEPKAVAGQLVMHPKGDYLLTSDSEHRIKVWSAKTLKLIRPLEGHRSFLKELRFHPTNDKLFFSSSSDGWVKLWSVDSVQPLRAVQAHSDAVGAMAFNQDGSEFLTSNWERDLKKWDATTFDLKETILQSKEIGICRAAAFSNNGHYFVGADCDGQIGLWRVSDGTMVRKWRAHRNFIKQFAFRPDDKAVVSSGNDHQVIYSELDTPYHRRLMKTGQNDYYWNDWVQWSADGKWLVVTSGDTSKTFIWSRLSDTVAEIRRGFETWNAVHHYYSVTDSVCNLTQIIANSCTTTSLKSPLLRGIADKMVTSPNGDKIVVQMDSLYIFDGKSHHLDTILAFVRPPESQLPRFTPDGSYLIASNLNREVHIWDTRNWQRLNILYDDFYQSKYQPFLTPNGKYKIIKYLDWFGIQTVETSMPNPKPPKNSSPEPKPKKRKFF